MEAIAIAAIVAGTGVTAYSAIEQGKAAEAQAKHQSAWQEYNAQVAELDAKAAERTASAEAKKTTVEAKSLMGGNISSLAERGSFSGSVLDKLVYTSSQLETDIQNVFRQGQTTANKYRSQAMLDRAGAEATLASGQNAKRASVWNAGSTIMTGLGSAGMFAYKSGMFTNATKVHPAGSVNLGKVSDYYRSSWLN